MARFTAFRARTARVFGVLRPRDWMLIFGVVAIGTCLAAALLLTVIDATRAREQATRQLEAQAAQAQDIRAAQSQRIDGLLAEQAELEARIAAQEATIAAQSQALADLTEQLRRADVEPLTGDPAASWPPRPAQQPAGDAGADPTPTSPGPQQPAPVPAPAPQPAPQPPPADEPVLCLPLDLLCIG